MADHRWKLSVVACAALCAVWGAHGAMGQAGRRIGQVRIILTTSVEEAVADDRSEVLVRAECRDSGSQRAVPDGTPVFLRTDLGDLTTDGIQRQKQVTVETENGFAEAFLSSSEEGTATITATARGDSRDSISVEFLPEGGLSGGRRDVLRVKATKIPRDASDEGPREGRKKPQYGSVSFSVDHHMIEAWHATVSHRRLVIAAPHLIVSVDGEYVRAWDAKLRIKHQSLEGDDLYYSLRKRKGVLWRVTDEGKVERLTFSGATLKPLDDASFEPPQSSDYSQELADTRVWLVCRSALVMLRRKIVLHRPMMWVEDTPLTRMPRYHVIRLDGDQSSILQFNSSGGLSIDYPYYLSVSSGEARAVHVQKGSQIDSLIPREGWSLCLSDEYDKNNASGKVWLEGLPEDDWSLQWRHREQVGLRSSASYYLGSRSLDTFQADATFGTLGRKAHTNTRISVSAVPRAPMHLRATADHVLTPKPIGRTGLYHRIGTRVSLSSRDYWADGPLFEHQISNGLSIRPWQPDRKTRVRPSIDSIITWNTRPSLGNYLRFQLGADRHIDRSQYLSVRYSVGRHFGGGTSSQGLRQQADLGYSLGHGTKWSLAFNGTYDIGEHALYGYGSASYQLTSQYRLNVLASMYRWRRTITSFNDLDKTEFASVGFNETEFTIWRKIGRRDIGLRYSTFDNRISFEIGGF